jgi:hypothetical protein
MENKTDNKTDSKTGNSDVDLARVIEQAIDKGASSAEEIHRAVGDLPITILENFGMEDTAHDVKNIQDRSIGAIYKMIRNVNHKVADLATDLLEQRAQREKENNE